MPDGRHVVRIYDEKLWKRIQEYAYKERVPTSELARRAIWAYVADPSIAAELTRENPDASYLSKRSLQRRYSHTVAKMQAAKNAEEKEQRKPPSARRKKLSEQIEAKVREQHPVPPVPDPFGLGF